jgi:predicted metal-dependent hydrolase
MILMTAEAYFAAPHGLERDAYLESLPPEALLQLGIDLYNAGHYWNAHEAWEQVWLDAEREQRAFYQGLIQVTAAFVHVTRDEYPGAIRLLDAGIEKLEKYPATYLGVQLGPLLAGARACRSRLQHLGEKRIADFDRALIPKIDTSTTA